MTVVDHCRSLQLLLDHRYDLSQFPQLAFETCLVDPKVAASELGPRVHRQRTAAFGLLDIAEHDRVRESQQRAALYISLGQRRVVSMDKSDPRL